MKLSFRTKTIALIAIVEAILLMVLVNLSINQLDKTNNEALETRAKTTIELFTSATKDAILSSDIARLNSIANDLMENDIIHRITITYFDEVILNLKNTYQKTQELKEDDHIEIEKLITEGGETFGKIHFEFGKSYISDMIDETESYMAFVALLEIILVAFISYILGSALTKQLRELSDGADEIAKGNWNRKINILSSDEVGETAQNFNRMMDTLNETHIKLEQETEVVKEFARELEGKVNERTKHLHNALEYQAKLIEHANAPIFALNTKGKFIIWNKKAEEITGLNIIDLKDFSFEDIFNHNMGNCQDFLKTIKISKYQDDIELNTKNKDNEIHWLMGCVFISNEQEEHIIFAGNDITEHKKIMSEIANTSKLATLGEMSTAMAHELNQPLNIIKMAAKNIERKSKKGNLNNDILVEKIQNIDEQIERATEIIDHMRIYGRKDAGENTTFNICEAIQSVVKMLTPQFNHRGITINTITNTDGNLMVSGKRIQLEQVITNLMTNARDAMEENNIVKPTITINTLVEQNSLIIQIADNGGGIPENILNRIFEPFFTTKEVGKGTGLGLSISHQIIKDMNSTIACENSEDGAIFTIKTPLVQ